MFCSIVDQVENVTLTSFFYINMNVWAGILTNPINFKINDDIDLEWSENF
jgi:hypothetical protein